MFRRSEVIDACRRWGAKLQVPEVIDGALLLWALSGCESTFGWDCAPRHEPYYHALAASGKNAQLTALTARYGCDAHSSFGPWQELLVNCSATMRPEDFADLERCAEEVVEFINSRILQREHATTVEEIAAAYNSGKWVWVHMPLGVQRYTALCRRYYDAASEILRR